MYIHNENIFDLSRMNIYVDLHTS